MAVSVTDIIKFVEGWRSRNGFDDDVKLEDNQIATFVSELQSKVKQMDFSVPNGTTVIGYSGDSNGEKTWKIAAKLSEIAGDGAMYISDLPTGTLIGKYRDDLVEA